jgi:hypothetical protein
MGPRMGPEPVIHLGVGGSCVVRVAPWVAPIRESALKKQVMAPSRLYGPSNLTRARQDLNVVLHTGVCIDDDGEKEVEHAPAKCLFYKVQLKRDTQTQRIAESTKCEEGHQEEIANQAITNTCVSCATICKLMTRQAQQQPVADVYVNTQRSSKPVRNRSPLCY